MRSIIYLYNVILIVISIILFGLGIYSEKLLIIQSSILLIWLNNILYSLANFYKRVIFLFFNISFGIFLLGRIIVRSFNNTYMWDKFPESITKHVFICLFLALLSIFLGYFIREIFLERKIKNSHQNKIKFTSKKILVIFRKNYEKVFLFGFYSTILFSFIDVYYNIQLSKQTGYLGQYLLTESPSPPLIYYLSHFNNVFFILTLAILPSYKKTLPILLIKLVNASLFLFTGKRIIIAEILLLIIIYFCFRHILDGKKSVWITKKKIGLSVFVIVFLLICFEYVGNIRLGTKASFDIGKSILSLFDSLGYSVETIALGKIHETGFPGNPQLYLFGPLINWFKDLFNIGVVYSGQTVETALYGYKFSSTLTYLEVPSVYLSGGGLGSSYLAEIYLGFGYTGIVIINLLLGCFFHFLKINQHDKLVIKYFKLYWLWGILTIPRFNVFSWFTDSISKTTIILLIFIFLVVLILSRNVNYKKQMNTN